MIRSKITIEGVPIIMEKDDGCPYIELQGELAKEADEERLKWLKDQAKKAENHGTNPTTDH